MGYIIALSAAFLIMLVAPFTFAAAYYRKKQGQILKINQNYVKEPRYFGLSMAKKIETGLAHSDGKTILMSKEEPFIDGDTDELPDEVDQLVICREKEFRSQGNVKNFHKEIYCAENAMVGGSEQKIRAVCGKKSLVLREGTEIVRWADAEQTVAAFDHCNLGLSTTAGERMSVGMDCKFCRLFAPEILLGQYPDENFDAMACREPWIFHLPVQIDHSKTVRKVTSKQLDENGLADCSILSKGNVELIANYVLLGDIRSHKSVEIGQNAIVCGNIFAEGDVCLRKNAAVLGNIFTQGTIYFEENTLAGRRGQITSVVAGTGIVFEKNCSVYGYIDCEKGCRVISDEEFEAQHREREQGVTPTGKSNQVTPSQHTDGNQTPAPHLPEYLAQRQHQGDVNFRSVEEFENSNPQSFRTNLYIKNVRIPDGAWKVKKSMFWSCKNLQELHIPNSVQMIEDYAFGECGKLPNLENLPKMELRKVGISAFQNCLGFTRLSFPACLQELGAAAFEGCKNLTEVEFPGNSCLKSMGDLCFKDCSKLTEITLPDSVETVGCNVFGGCTALRQVSVPERCAQQPGIQKLREIQGIRLMIRSTPKNTEGTTDEK